MRKKESKPIDIKTRGRNPRILVCDRAGGIADPPSPEEEWVASPIQCLDEAVDWKPNIIVVSFGQMSIPERETCVELCAALKRNSHTRMCTVLALLHSKHRQLIEDLERAKVDYVRHIAEGKLDSRLVRRIIENFGPGDRLDSYLATLCHFLHYSKIDSNHEIPLCGAYLDRMALGGRRLHDVCETDDHHGCEYYLHPRHES